jgi:hypothetical protein
MTGHGIIRAAQASMTVAELEWHSPWPVEFVPRVHMRATVIVLSSASQCSPTPTTYAGNMRQKSASAFEWTELWSFVK